MRTGTTRLRPIDDTGQCLFRDQEQATVLRGRQVTTIDELLYTAGGDTEFQGCFTDGQHLARPLVTLPFQASGTGHRRDPVTAFGIVAVTQHDHQRLDAAIGEGQRQVQIVELRDVGDLHFSLPFAAPRRSVLTVLFYALAKYFAIGLRGKIRAIFQRGEVR